MPIFIHIFGMKYMIREGGVVVILKELQVGAVALSLLIIKLQL